LKFLSPLLVVGAAGGPTIITGTSQVILNVIDHHSTLADAMRAPRVHHQALPDSLTDEVGGITPAVLDCLRAMGYGPRKQRSLVNINAIMRVTGDGKHSPNPAAAAPPWGIEPVPSAGESPVAWNAPVDCMGVHRSRSQTARQASWTALPLPIAGLMPGPFGEGSA
jgi:hypothetical protein